MSGPCKMEIHRLTQDTTDQQVTLVLLLVKPQMVLWELLHASSAAKRPE